MEVSQQAPHLAPHHAPQHPAKPPQSCLICPLVNASPVAGPLIDIGPFVTASHVKAGFSMYAHDRCLKAPSLEDAPAFLALLWKVY